jgi:rod shape-determining protein MreD
MDTPLRRLGHALAASMPFMIAVVLAMVIAVPLQLPHIGAVAPSLTLAAVYYWAVYRPDLFGYGAAFCLGLFTDLMTGAPLGLSALVLVAVQAVSVTQRRFFLGKPFHILWWGFALIAPVAMLLAWVLASIYQGTLLAIGPVLLQAVLTVALFPAVAWLLGRCHALLPRVPANAKSG